MAKLINGILGGISGKIGNIVGARWKDMLIVRTAPKPTTKPRTAKQLAQIAKFKFVQEFLGPFKPYFTVGFRNEAKNRTECNVAFSLNYKTAIFGDAPNFEIDYSSLVMSSGRLANLFNPKIVFSSANTLTLTWENIDESLSSPDDQLTLMLYSPELKKTEGFIGGVSRSAESHTFELNPRIVGKTLEIYVSTSSINRSQLSNSLYLGRRSR